MLQQLQDAQQQQQVLQRRLQEQLEGVNQQPFVLTPVIEPQVPELQTPLQSPEVIIFRADPEEVFPLEPEPPPCTTLSGESGVCRPLVRCITFYAEVPELRRQPCNLQERELGVCCPLKKRPTGESCWQAVGTSLGVRQYHTYCRCLPYFTLYCSWVRQYQVFAVRELYIYS